MKLEFLFAALQLSFLDSVSALAISLVTIQITTFVTVTRSPSIQRRSQSPNVPSIALSF